MRKFYFLTGLFVCSLLLVTACGNTDTTSSADNDKKTASNAKEKQVASNVSTDTKTSSAKASNSSISNSGVMNKEMVDELSSAKTEVVYENNKPNITSNQKGFKFNVDKYQVVHVSNMNKGENYFDGATEGYIVSVKASVNNQSKGKVYFNLPDLQGINQFDTYLNRRSFVYQSMLKPDITSTVDEPAYYKQGEKQTGLFEYYLTKEAYEKLKTAHTKMIIHYASSNKEMTNHLGEQQTLDFPLAKVSKKEIEKTDAAEPYQDSILDKNIAEKDILNKKASLNLTQKNDKVNVTVEGVEYSKLNPTETWKNEFTSYDGEDVVAASVKLKVKNNTNSDITLRQFSVFLQNEKMRFLDQGSLGTDGGTVSPNNEGEKYLVFLMKRKTDYEATNQFILRITHITNKDGKDLLSKEMDFQVPTK